MAMHKYFPDWYRIAAPDPRPETLQSRWGSIEKIAAALDTATALEVVRVFLGLPTKDTAYTESFASLFREDDASFPLKNNKVELQVLAGSTIAECLESYEPDVDTALTIALAVEAATFSGRKITVIIPDIVTLAKEHLREESLSAREPAPIAMAKVRETIAAPAENVKAVLPVLDALIDRNNILQEETNILWWVFGGYSEGLSKLFKEMDVAIAATAAPVELASLVKVLPGPLSTRAILSVLLRSVNKTRPATSIAEAIEAIARDWKEKQLAPTHIDGALDLCPVMYAMKKSLDTPKKKWREAATKASQTLVEKKISPLEFAEQLFKENLLLKSLAS